MKFFNHCLFFFLLIFIISCSTFPHADLKRQTASVQSNFDREDKGDVISQGEKERATDELIALLKDTNYFDFADSRIHGMPENDSTRPFWWGTMWTGITAQKLNGQVTYIHSNDGTDNAGIQTAPYLEGACFAYLLTGDKKHAHLARKIMRGMSAWILSSAKSVDDEPLILSRSFYPPSFHSMDGGRNLYVNYDASRPGINSKASEYVHNPNNPYFGDIWLKAKRSIDDIGHMIRAIAQVQACRGVFDDDAKADLDQMNSLYSTWASDVDSNHFKIPTYNLTMETILPKYNSFGNYNNYKMAIGDPACVEKLAVRFLHTNETKNLRCKKGITLWEKLIARFLQNDAIEVLRSHHIASVAMADFRGLPELADSLRRGLAERLDRDFKVAKNNKLSPKYDVQDIATFFVHANNVGVPLKSNEIRFLYDRLHTAYVGMREHSNFNTFHLFDPSVPDGKYSYNPPNIGLYYYTLGPMIGACTSAYRNPNVRPLFDCERLKNALMSSTEK